MPKRRALLLLLALWLPLQGLAGTLLHCDTLEALSGHHAVAELSAEARSPADHGGCDGTSERQNAGDCDHCQQCCQMSSTLLLSASPAAEPPPATQICQPVILADSITADPLLHPPKHLS